jgi:hypothetical protein
MNAGTLGRADTGGTAAGSPQAHPEAPPETKVPTDDISLRLRVAGIFFRSIFLIVLLVVVARVSAPQQLRSTWLDMSSGDFIRAGLGLGFSVWMLVHIFLLPKDAAAYKTWVYLGLAVTPYCWLALPCGETGIAAMSFPE